MRADVERRKKDAFSVTAELSDDAAVVSGEDGTESDDPEEGRTRRGPRCEHAHSRISNVRRRSAPNLQVAINGAGTFCTRSRWSKYPSRQRESNRREHCFFASGFQFISSVAQTGRPDRAPRDPTKIATRARKCSRILEFAMHRMTRHERIRPTTPALRFAKWYRYQASALGVPARYCATARAIGWPVCDS
jgi:hypothetical protein